MGSEEPAPEVAFCSAVDGAETEVPFEVVVGSSANDGNVYVKIARLEDGVEGAIVAIHVPFAAMILPVQVGVGVTEARANVVARIEAVVYSSEDAASICLKGS